jgi:hypothetical protein
VARALFNTPRRAATRSADEGSTGLRGRRARAADAGRRGPKATTLAARPAPVVSGGESEALDSLRGPLGLLRRPATVHPSCICRLSCCGHPTCYSATCGRRPKGKLAAAWRGVTSSACSRVLSRNASAAADAESNPCAPSTALPHRSPRHAQPRRGHVLAPSLMNVCIDSSIYRPPAWRFLCPAV